MNINNNRIDNIINMEMNNVEYLKYCKDKRIKLYREIDILDLKISELSRVVYKECQHIWMESCFSGGPYDKPIKYCEKCNLQQN